MKLTVIEFTSGWGGRIRTYECRIQRPVPYHLATPQLEIEEKRKQPHTKSAFA